MSAPNHKIAVVLFQLGGPDSLEAVEPFLRNLFRDPDIINFPGAFLARRPLARFIASRRATKVAEHYREIGGKSPILELTLAQARALETRLNGSARVFVAMRYWHPLTQEVIPRLKEQNFQRVILLPLYPQYSKATTLSSMKEWTRQCNVQNFNHVPSEGICCYYNHPLYIEGIVDNINRTFAKFQPRIEEVDLVFSAHGVPMSLVEEGDPYTLQIEETVRLVAKKGGWPSPSHLCYQSRVGPAEWVKPSLTDTIRDLAASGRKKLLVVPVAFVTEHIETLHEIDIEARALAQEHGIEQFEMMGALNDRPKFIECLEDLVLRRLRGEPMNLPGCRDFAQCPALCPHGR